MKKSHRIFEIFKKRGPLLVISLKKHVTEIISSLNNLKSDDIPDSLEDVLHRSIEETDDDRFLKGILLGNSNTGRRSFNFQEFRSNDCSSAIEFLISRMDVDSELFQKIEPSVELSSETDIRRVHAMIGRDISLPIISLQFSELRQRNNFLAMSLPEKVSFLLSANAEEYLFYQLEFELTHRTPPMSSGALVSIIC